VLAQENNLPNQKMLMARQYCGPFMDVFKTPEKYKEGMLFVGDGVTFEAQSGRMFQSGMFFFVNQETGTWSLINVYGDGMACMVQTGKNFKPYTGTNPWDKKPGVEQ
jgi:hypothetical protein